MFKQKKVQKQQSPKELLADVINTAAVISPMNLQKILNIFEQVEYEKNTQIIREGEITNYIYFVSKGIIRVYYYSNGKEIIDWFAEEGAFFGNLYSHIMQKPGFDIYESVEEVVLLRVRYEDLEQLFSEVHEIDTTARKIMEQYYVRYVERVHHIKGLTAEEKYHYFIENYGSYLNRIPLKYVADYLGISAETLSRIRAKDNKK